MNERPRRGSVRARRVTAAAVVACGLVAIGVLGYVSLGTAGHHRTLAPAAVRVVDMVRVQVAPMTLSSTRVTFRRLDVGHANLAFRYSPFDPVASGPDNVTTEEALTSLFASDQLTAAISDVEVEPGGVDVVPHIDILRSSAVCHRIQDLELQMHRPYSVMQLVPGERDLSAYYLYAGGPGWYPERSVYIPGYNYARWFVLSWRQGPVLAFIEAEIPPARTGPALPSATLAAQFERVFLHMQPAFERAIAAHT